MLFNFIVFLLTLLYVTSTFGHLCLWQPMQRANFSIDHPGSHDCYRKNGPCGGFDSSTSKGLITVEAGTIYTVLFQQHLNHYYPPNPGKLDISFGVGADPLEENFEILTSFNDYNPMNHNTQTNFSIKIQFPNEPCDHCVLRVRYLTNNPDEEDHGTTFYQCSDIQLTKSYKKVKDLILNEKVKTKHENDPHDCCTPPSFETTFIHWIPDISYTSSGVIYYDQLSKQMRVNMIVMDVEYNMWMNFTSGKQFYYNVNSKSCHLFGLDYWNDWCYGNTFNQTEDFLNSDVSCSSGVFNYCNRWKNGDFIFDSTSFGCYPDSITRLSNGEKTIYFNPKDGPFPSSIFTPNTICLTKPIIIDQHHSSSKLFKHLIQKKKFFLN